MSNKVNRNEPFLQKAALKGNVYKLKGKEERLLKNTSKGTLFEQLSDVSGGFDDRYRFYYPEDD